MQDAIEFEMRRRVWWMRINLTRSMLLVGFFEWPPFSGGKFYWRLRYLTLGFSSCSSGLYELAVHRTLL